MKTYFPILDGVRFFAAFWVMNFHYLLGLGESGSLHWYRYGNLGVQLFFIISGFVIVQSLKTKTTSEFAAGRFIRLFPLFWILCSLTYFITLIVPGAYNLTPQEYLISMTMLGDTVNGLFHYDGLLIDPSYWTLTVELLFYTGIGIFTFFFSYKKIRYFFALWILVSAVAFLTHIEHNFFVKLALVRHTAYFVFGGTLALIATMEVKSLFEKRFDWALLFVSALYATLIHPRALPAYLNPNPLDTEIVTTLHILFFAGIFFFVSLSRSIKNTRAIGWLALLGGLTYPLYLLHQTIGNTLINYAVNTYNIPRPTFVLLFEAFIILIAYIAYRQDKVLRAWLQKKLSPKKDA